MILLVMIVKTICSESNEMLTSKGLDKVELLNQELEQVKARLADKEKLMTCYQSRIEELRNMVQKEKCDKILENRYCMTENTICGTDNVNQPSVYKELETTQIQLCQMEKEVTQLKKKLKDADCNIKRLRSDLVASEKNAREMRSALTAEVAEKHDQVLALRREVNQLEDQLRQADMQTHFKDDIIKELRKEVKVARSKETLVEVLGIKERSLTHLEHLTEQLEQKENMISCLQAQLQRRGEHSPHQDTLYRVKQQVDWFTENMLQQCAHGNVPEEFKKCITTMLEELRESIDCCNLGPANPLEGCKESLGFVMALQSSLNQHHESLSQSWGSIWDITHQINKTDLGPCIEQWRNHNCKQHLIQKRIQEVLQSIIKNLSSSNINAKGMMSSMDAVLHSLGSIKEKLNMQPVRKNISHWLDNIHILVCDAIAKIEAVSQTFTIFKKEQGSFNCEVQKQVKCLDSLQEELDQLLAVQERAYDKLLKLDKAQSMKTDTLLATVLHHEEAWDQFNRTLKDMNKELHSLSRNSQCAKQSNEKRSRSPVEQRTLHVKSLVTKISADIRESISDIEHRQSQATHLEVDLSSIGLVLESAQKEMVDITKDRSSKDISELVICLINKLNKELNNALTKTVSLVEIYKNAKKNYIKSSKRILQIQREFDSLEEELHNFHYYICQDSDQPKSPHRDTRTCPIQAELDNYKNRVSHLNKRLDWFFENRENIQCPEKKDKLQCNNKSLKENCTKMQTSPVKRDAAMKVVNVLELKSNIKDFYQLACNQDETICLLQNSLKICQKEGDELRKKIKCLESKKEEAENGCEKRIKCYQEKICELQNALKKSEDVTVWKDSESLRILQNANLELATIAGQVQEDYRCLQLRFSDIHNRMVESEKKHQRSEAALQIVIANLKERMGKEQKRLCDVLKERKQLQEELRNATTGSKLELENIKEREASSNQENQSYIDELKKQAKCWSVRMADIEAELMNVKEKFCEELHNKEDLQHQLSEKEADFKKEICEKYKEINKLTTAVNSLNDKLKEKEAELVCERAKQCETEQKLMSLCSAYDQLKIKAKEKEETAGKLHAALTQLSNKFVSRRLDNKDCIRHYQEECAKFEALYNTTACKLHSKELELCTLIQENERLKNELQEISICPPQEKEEESCPFLLERVQQLTKDLQNAQSFRSSYETLLKELTEKCSKKEEEVSQLKVQLNQYNLQMQNLQRLMCDSQSPDVGTTGAGTALSPNIELQREISTALSSQLRVVKKRLHATRHDYKKLQADYEDLNRKYNLLQKSEKEYPKERKPHCLPCSSKSSKSAVHLKYSEGSKREEPSFKIRSHTKSWDKFTEKVDTEDMDIKWKKRLKSVKRDDDDDLSSSSN